MAVTSTAQQELLVTLQWDVTTRETRLAQQRKTLVAELVLPDDKSAAKPR